ncbi:MAG TPA: PQQ-binding-like beta-propeller repeat protein [Nannocystis sp.]
MSGQARAPRRARGACFLGHVLWALSLGACAGEVRTVVPHPQPTPGARANLELVRVQQVALADFGVMNPDEFGGVATDAARGVIYVGTRGGLLLALSMETGEVVWEQQLQGAISSIPKLAEDGALLLVGTDNGELLAIELESRKTRWTYTTLGTIRNEPLVHDGTVYVVNSRDQVFALELSTGAWRWQYEQPYPTEFTVHGHAGLSYLPPEEEVGANSRGEASGEGAKTSGEAPNGEAGGGTSGEGAKTRGGAAGEHGEGAKTSSGAAGEHGEGAKTSGDAAGERGEGANTRGGAAGGGEPASEPEAEDDEEELDDPWSGEEQEEGLTAGAGSSPLPDPADGLLFTGFSNGKVVAIGARSGEPLWVANVAPPAGGDFVDADGTPLILRERGEVVVTGQSTGVYGLSLADGEERWFRPIRGAGTVVAGPRGLMLVASGLEGLYALEQGGKVRWRRQLNPGFLQAPLVVGDVAFLSHSDDGLLAFDVETGEYLAGLDTGSGVSGPPVYDAALGRFYTLSNRGMLVVFRTVGSESPLPGLDGSVRRGR